MTERHADHRLRVRRRRQRGKGHDWGRDPRVSGELLRVERQLSWRQLLLSWRPARGHAYELPAVFPAGGPTGFHNRYGRFLWKFLRREYVHALGCDTIFERSCANE